MLAHCLWSGLVAYQELHDGNCTRPRPAAVHDGSIDSMFRALMRNYPQYSPRALSTDPWVVTLDNFLSDEEASHIITLCAARFEPSKTQTEGTLQRTSDTCWGDDHAFQTNSSVLRVLQRVEEITLVPQANGEPLQVLRYQPGQYYTAHHDQNADPSAPQGARIYSLLMYLEEPAAGGGTKFNDLGGLVVMPKKGRAVLWPNVMADSVLLPELRAHHEALPVEGGVKLAANLWLHAFAYSTLREQACWHAHIQPNYEPDTQLVEYVEARQRFSRTPEVPEALSSRLTVGTLDGSLARASLRPMSFAPRGAGRRPIDCIVWSPTVSRRRRWCPQHVRHATLPGRRWSTWGGTMRPNTSSSGSPSARRHSSSPATTATSPWPAS